MAAWRSQEPSLWRDAALSQSVSCLSDNKLTTQVYNIQHVGVQMTCSLQLQQDLFTLKYNCSVYWFALLHACCMLQCTAVKLLSRLWLTSQGSFLPRPPPIPTDPCGTDSSWDVIALPNHKEPPVDFVSGEPKKQEVHRQTQGLQLTLYATLSPPFQGQQFRRWLYASGYPTANC